MSDAAPPRIVLLAPRQAKDASAVLARSHADYPSFRHLYPDAERRARVLAAVFRQRCSAVSPATRPGSDRPMERAAATTKH